MVYNGNPIKMDDLGVPLFSETSNWTRRKYRSTWGHQLGAGKLAVFASLWTSSCSASTPKFLPNRQWRPSLHSSCTKQNMQEMLNHLTWQILQSEINCKFYHLYIKLYLIYSKETNWQLSVETRKLNLYTVSLSTPWHDHAIHIELQYFTNLRTCLK